MGEHIITINAGSSSIKFALFALDGDTEPRLVASGQVDGLGADVYLKAKSAEGLVIHDEDLPDDHGHAEGLAAVLNMVKAKFPQAHIAAIGHRVVHGGARFAQATLIDDAVVTSLHELEPLAPLHLPHAVAGIEATRRLFPTIPQVACFDTAFHQGHAFVHDAYALPRHLYDEGIRRYGFHGLSYEYIAARMAGLAPDLAGARVIVAHLGNGASMCAMHAGRSVASTMGFTALDGLAMGTRCGSIDPGVILYLMQSQGLSAEQVNTLLYKDSGLKGLSGFSQDMRELEASSDPHAQQAIDYFCASICREAGALTAALGGLDAFVFTAGIGEHSSRVRETVLRQLGWLGIEMDDQANHARGDRRISTHHSPTQAWVIATNEEAMIVRHVLAIAGITGQPTKACA